MARTITANTLVAPTGLPGEGFTEAPADGQGYLRDGSTNGWAPGVEKTVSTTAPTSPSAGDMWMNPTTNDIQFWNGTAWIASGATVFTSSTAPTTATPGDLWFDPDSAELFVWYDDGTSAQWVIATAGTSSASIFLGADPPPTPAAGNLWFDPNSAQLFIWFDDGTSAQWVICNSAPTGAPVDLTTILADLEARLAALEAAGP
jgi:hypothetical protein